MTLQATRFARATRSRTAKLGRVIVAALTCCSRRRAGGPRNRVRGPARGGPLRGTRAAVVIRGELKTVGQREGNPTRRLPGGAQASGNYPDRKAGQPSWGPVAAAPP